MLKMEPSRTASLFFIFLFLFFFAVFVSIQRVYTGGTPFREIIFQATSPKDSSLKHAPLQCNDTAKKTWNKNSTIIRKSSSEECPEYFRWIHEDLRPWKDTGITKEVVESARNIADFRLVTVEGRIYLVRYKGAFQTRDVFSIWGILQLLRLYPGELPDLDLMFSCGDAPAIRKHNYQSGNATSPPPAMLGYCANSSTTIILFPDWSFWGWPEVHIEPWEPLKKKLQEGNKKSNWTQREPYAYWKGNKDTSKARVELSHCNATHIQHWPAKLYHVDWRKETRRGFKGTNLASQCTHKYKIYVEGITWSVSQKYILACDSMSLVVKPKYQDFFSRSLVPLKHYWPINSKKMCRSLKFAVEWGNKHHQKAQEIGKAGSRFMMEELKMKNVYDYMFNLLNEYAKLLRYKPTVPQGAVELCTGKSKCMGKEGKENDFKLKSMVHGPSDTDPCKMPSAYDPQALKAFLEGKETLEREVESWEEKGKV